MPTKIKRCLLCNSYNLHNKSFMNYLFSDDDLCDSCRQAMPLAKRNIKLDALEVFSLYCYQGAVRSNLLQYKEGYDEAIAGIFMYPFQKQFNRKYRGYTIVFMPSSKSKQKLRGFNHLAKMFSFSNNVKLDMLEKIKDINQKELIYQKRLENRDNFNLLKYQKVKRILLVDDVITTGASVLGAYAQLQRICDDIKVFTIAYNKAWLSQN